MRAKASKLEVLEFIKRRRLVFIYQLVEEFGYTYRSAKCRLGRLKKQGLVISDSKGCWVLTDEGIRRLRWLKHKMEQQEKEATSQTQ